MTRALLGIAALVVAIGAGAALGALLFRPVSPRGLEETPAAVDTPVVQRTIDDRRSIRLALELGPSASLKSPSDGLITESACQAGQAIASGDHMMTLGNQRLYALATAIPCGATWVRAIKATTSLPCRRSSNASDTSSTPTGVSVRKPCAPSPTSSA